MERSLYLDGAPPCVIGDHATPLYTPVKNKPKGKTSKERAETFAIACNTGQCREGIRHRLNGRNS